MEIRKFIDDFGKEYYEIRIVDPDEAEDLGFDADTVLALDRDEDLVLEILAFPDKREAVFALRELGGMSYQIYEDLDYDFLNLEIHR